MKKKFCEYKIKNRYLIYIVICSFFLGSFLGILVHPVSATISGDYYNCDFNTYNNGVKWVNQTDSVYTWLRYSGSSGSVVYNQQVQFNASNSFSYFNHTIGCDEFYFSITSDVSTYGGGFYREFNLYVCDSLGAQLLHLYERDRYAGSDHKLTLYGKTDAIVLYNNQAAGDLTSVGLYKVVFFSNQSIRFTTTSGFKNSNYTYNLGSSFSNNVHVKILTAVTPGSTNKIRLDNYMFLIADSSPWEIVSDYQIGNVLYGGTNYTSYLTSTEVYNLVEENYVMQYGSLNVRQFGFAVSTKTELSKMNIVLHLNGVDCGYYDVYYTYPTGLGVDGRYVLVWQNINLSFYTDSLKIEVIAIGSSLPCWFEYMVTNTDVDNDGNKEFKYSTGISNSVLPYFNGLYDGKSVSTISEPQYKIWSSFTSGQSSCNIDFTRYEHKGQFSSVSAVSSGSKFLEVLYNIPSNFLLRGVQLQVGKISIEAASQTNDYYLKVNGEAVGASDCIYKYDDNSYIITWNFTKSITNDVVLFEFSSPITTLYLLRSNVPLDDGSVGVKTHNSYSLWEGVYTGNVYSYDVCYRFYYSSFSFQNETSSYSDLITSSKTSFYTYDTIPVYYFISDYSYTNSISLWKSGVQQSVQGFPVTITSGDSNGELSFTPFHNGSYQFRLVRNSIVRSSFNFTVTDPSDTDFILAVYPNPCIFNEEINVGYRFYPDDGADGFIGISEFSDTSNFSSFSESWLLSANTSGNKTFFVQTNMYVSLWKKTGSSYVRMKIKYLKMLSMFDNTINVGYKSIQLSDAVPSVSQRIYGTQVVQGFNTFVRMNNKLLQYVTDTPFYNVYVDVSKGGNYNVELCVETANGSKVLCSVNFTVSSPAAGSGAGVEAFPYEMKLLFGICCILVAVSCPLMISVKYHVTVPTFVYVVFMAFGIGIGTVLGFLELWLVFLFVVALVAGAVFTIFGHGGQGGGGDSGTILKGGILSRRRGKDYATASRKADYGVSPKGSPGYLKGPGRRGY